MDRRADLPVMRSLVTLAVLAALVAVSRLALPGVHPDSWAYGLSLLPTAEQYLWSYLLVEAVVGLVPALRKRRAETTGDGPALFRAAIAVALATAAFNGIRLAEGLERLEAEEPGTIVAPGFWFRLAVVASIVGATALVAVLALAVSRRGLGSGFALLCAAGWSIDAPLLPVVEQAAFGGVLAQLALYTATLVAGFLWLRRAALRAPADDARRALPLPTAGILPLLLLGELAHRAARQFPFDFLTNRLAAPLIFALLGGIVLSALLVRTGALARAYGVEPARIRRVRLAGTGLSLAWLAALVLVEDYAARAQVRLDGLLLGLVIAAAFLDDLVEEWRFRSRHGAVVAVHELRRLWLGGLVRAACGERGIPVLLRGASFRSLFQGLGPIFEVTVLVPEAHAEAARELVRARLAAALGEAAPPAIEATPIAEPG